MIHFKGIYCENAAVKSHLILVYLEAKIEEKASVKALNAHS